MRSVSLRLVDLERKPLIPLGFEGENEYMTINFDCKTVFDKHPAAVPTLAVTPPQGDSYPAVVVRDGDIVSWTVCDSDLVYPGEGELQLTFVDGTIIGKTYKARTKVLDSITPSGEAPTPIQNWLIQAAAALQALPTEVASSVAALMGAMVGVGETLDPDDDVTVNYDPVNNTLTIGVPHGRDGEDGHTPAIAAEKVGKVATFYVDGVAIVQISDGQDADPTALIDDTSTAQNRTWSAKKLDEEKQSLKTEINSRSEIKDSTKTGVDLDVSDEDGNVLLRLKDGHIQTKSFRSQGVASLKESTETDIDLDISDNLGNVILRLSKGHIKTKNFDSSHDVVNDWDGARYCSFGDSITWQDGRAYGQGQHIGEIARGYQTVMSERLGFSYHNNQGKSGWSMAIKDGNGCVNTIKAIVDYTDYDLVTIACGTNDFKLNVPLGTLGIIGDVSFDDTTFYGAYRDAVEYILTNNPNVRIVLLTPLQRDNDHYDVNSTNTAGYKLIDYVDAVRDIGQMYALPVCDMFANSGFTKKTLSTYTMDGLHPNDDGYKRMGDYLCRFVIITGK